MKHLKNSYFPRMYSKLSLLHLILIIVPVFSACRGPEAKEKETQGLAALAFLNPFASEKYVIDTKESVVTYKGSMAVGANSHSGYVYLSKGELMIDNGKLVGGTVEVDMNTIADEKHGSENDLVRHLKSADFFEVEKFPTTAFVISQIAPATGEAVTVTGNLTIKGITHAVTFPAKIEVKDGIVQANGKVTIDRTKWDVRYNSGKFFSNLADGVISDDIEFEMKLVAKR